MSVTGGLVSAGTGLLGGYGQTRDISRGMADYRKYVGQGTDVLSKGLSGVAAAYDPYTSVGSQGAADASTAINTRTQATQPTLSNISAASAKDYLDPSADYSIDQANKAATAQGIASGATGGGMMKALTNNANKMAQTNWNNALTSAMNAANLNFGQQQQQYTNTNDYQQQQIQNQMGLANMGLGATNSSQQTQLGYNTAINDNYNQIAANQMSGWANKGNIFNNTVSGLGKTVASFL